MHDLLRNRPGITSRYEIRPRVAGRVEPRTLEAFRLLAFEGLAGEEVARRLGMTVSSVFVAKCRVLKLLKDEVHAIDQP